MAQSPPSPVSKIIHVCLTGSANDSPTNSAISSFPHPVAPINAISDTSIPSHALRAFHLTNGSPLPSHQFPFNSGNLKLDIPSSSQATHNQNSILNGPSFDSNAMELEPTSTPLPQAQPLGILIPNLSIPENPSSLAECSLTPSRSSLCSTGYSSTADSPAPGAYILGPAPDSETAPVFRKPCASQTSLSSASSSSRLELNYTDANVSGVTLSQHQKAATVPFAAVPTTSNTSTNNTGMLGGTGGARISIKRFESLQAKRLSLNLAPLALPTPCASNGQAVGQTGERERRRKCASMLGARESRSDLRTEHGGNLTAARNVMSTSTGALPNPFSNPNPQGLSLAIGQHSQPDLLNAVNEAQPTLSSLGSCRPSTVQLQLQLVPSPGNMHSDLHAQSLFSPTQNLQPIEAFQKIQTNPQNYTGANAALLSHSQPHIAFTLGSPLENPSNTQATSSSLYPSLPAASNEAQATIYPDLLLHPEARTALHSMQVQQPQSLAINHCAPWPGPLSGPACDGAHFTLAGVGSLPPTGSSGRLDKMDVTRSHSSGASAADIFKVLGVTDPERQSELQKLPGPSHILPHLFLGSQLDAFTEETIKSHGITHVLNISTNCPQSPYVPNENFLRIPAVDNLQEKLLPHFAQAFTFLDQVREQGGRVLMHCHAGISRSATFAIAYIMHSTQCTSEEAQKRVKRIRGVVAPNFAFLGQLIDFENHLKVQREALTSKPAHSLQQPESMQAEETPSNPHLQDIRSPNPRQIHTAVVPAPVRIVTDSLVSAAPMESSSAHVDMAASSNASSIHLPMPIPGVRGAPSTGPLLSQSVQPPVPRARQKKQLYPNVTAPLNTANGPAQGPSPPEKAQHPASNAYHASLYPSLVLSESAETTTTMQPHPVHRQQPVTAPLKPPPLPPKSKAVANHNTRSSPGSSASSPPMAHSGSATPTCPAPAPVPGIGAGAGAGQTAHALLRTSSAYTLSLGQSSAHAHVHSQSASGLGSKASPELPQSPNFFGVISIV